MATRNGDLQTKKEIQVFLSRLESAVSLTRMLRPEQRVKVNLSGMVVQGVAFSQNVREVLGTIVRQTSADPPVYLVELLFSFKGVKRVEVPEERVQPA